MSHSSLKHCKIQNGSRMSQLRNQECRFVGHMSSTFFTEKNIDLESFHRDKKGRRIIKRISLYKDPDLFNIHLESNNRFGQRFQGWLKAGEGANTVEECGNTNKKQNKVQKKLDEMLAKPVQITKAERMMEKMGWQGGALGKHGEGIIEPIAPNASYATNTVGLGRNEKRLKNVLKNKKNGKQYFDTNVLLHILDFVKCDLEHEIVFECCLWKKERKWVHKIVEALASNDDAVSTDFDTIPQMDIAQEIFKFNNYLLTTESEGVVPNRFLCLYKEAPENMYLVTPDDLNKDNTVDNPEEVDNSNLNKKIRDTTKDTISTNNQVAKKISETNEGNTCTVNDLLLTIMEYFTEFIEDDNYTEFRFLGPFNNEEMKAVNIFIEKCTKNDFDGNDKLQTVFKNNVIEMKENCNGSIIFCKPNKRKENF